jgi:hypothetical protein
MTYGLDDLGSEVLSWFQDGPSSGGTKLNSLAKDRCHSGSKNRDNKEQLHPEKRVWESLVGKKVDSFAEGNGG